MDYNPQQPVNTDTNKMDTSTYSPHINAVPQCDKPIVAKELRNFPIKAGTSVEIYFGPNGNAYFWELPNGRWHLFGITTRTWETSEEVRLEVRSHTSQASHHALHV
jgi:hypothetical protein